MSTLARSFIASLVIGLMGWGVMPAQAQVQTPDSLTKSQKTAGWMKQFDQQLVRLLWAPDAERQDNAMQLIIHYAQYENASGQPVFDFGKATPRLLNIYKHAPERGRRLLALAALGAIGDTSVMQELASTVPTESSDVVRQHTMRVLSAHLQQQ